MHGSQRLCQLTKRPQPVLNDFAALPANVRRDTRLHIQDLFARDTPAGLVLERQTDVLALCIVPIAAATMHLPFRVGDFTDACISADHLSNASRAVLGDASLPPRFPYAPIAYAGRCSSLVMSGTPVVRPCGQYKDATTGEVVFGPTRKFDYELELACFISKPTTQGERLSAAEAIDHVFGCVILNDWSSRDIQSAEMAPLGP